MNVGKTLYDCTIGYQWLLYIATLCVVHRDNRQKRRYTKGIVEIARKNFKTFTIGTIFILLFLTEPQFSKFYSVAPDKRLSKDIQNAINEILGASPYLLDKFKRLRDVITCKLNNNVFTPLAYSNDKLDACKPSAFVVDEVGALPNNYAIESMESGQTGLYNKLGFVISTKYPKSNNPFEDEVSYAKKVLNKIIDDEQIFALLYEPDNTKDWETDNVILEQANPAALEVEGIMQDILDKRQKALEVESKRENFVTKHCNIIYQGIGTESYIDIKYLRECKIDEPIDWTGMEIWAGCDLAITTDNCSVPMLGYRDGIVYCKPMVFIPEDNIESKSKVEKFDYYEAINRGEVIACGDRTVDYSVIEDYVFNLEQKYGVKIQNIGFDRYNALSSAQKWDKKYNVTEVKQHSSVLHAPTKLLEELILNHKFAYNDNKIMEVNFENARCTYDTNLNRYVNKKKSNGKVDIVVGIINALYMMQQDLFLDDGGFCVQVI